MSDNEIKNSKTFFLGMLGSLTASIIVMVIQKISSGNKEGTS